MGALLVSGHAHVWELVALQAVGGAAVAFYSPASTGLVPETVPQPLLQQANAFMSIARYAAFPVGADERVAFDAVPRPECGVHSTTSFTGASGCATLASESSSSKATTFPCFVG